MSRTRGGNRDKGAGARGSRGVGVVVEGEEETASLRSRGCVVSSEGPSSMREKRCSASSNLFPLTHAAITALYCASRGGEGR